MVVLPFLALPLQIRLIDFYNRYVLSQALLQIAQESRKHNESDSASGSGESNRNQMEGGWSTIRGVWMVLKNSQQPSNSTALIAVQDVDNSNNINGNTTKNKNKGNNKDGFISARAISWLKFLSSNTFYGILFMIVFLPLLINYITVLAKEPCYNIHLMCYSCNRSAVTITIVIGLIIIVLALFFAYLVRRFPDPFGIVREVRNYAIFGGIPSIVCVFIIPSYEDGFSPYFSFNWIWLVSVSVLQFISTDLQIYIAKKEKKEQKRENNKLTAQISTTGPSTLSSSITDKLQKCLDDPKQISLFEKHLVSEFAVETITMYVDCVRFSATYFDMNENTRRVRARRIIQQHVGDNAVMQVNLSFEIRSELLAAVNNSSKPVEQHLFEKAKNEIFHMLLGSYIRFLKSDLYKSSSIESS